MRHAEGTINSVTPGWQSLTIERAHPIHRPAGAFLRCGPRSAIVNVLREEPRIEHKAPGRTPSPSSGPEELDVGGPRVIERRAVVGGPLPLAADVRETTGANARSTGHPARPMLAYRSPPHPPIPEFPKRGKVVRGHHVILATLAGAAFFACMDAHWMPLTAWTVSMACVYVLVRAGAAKHLTAARRVQVILAAFLSIVATFGVGVTYWGRALRFELHAPPPACRWWLALLATSVAWFLLARRNRRQASRPPADGL